ncbi:L-asparaginase-like isoform X1 [Porites lutea]|uniref:L-asparaginase-like isoform X1 n=1 Tax=Porites lutea TaxID=51062 RepID=UPI003CC51E53
MSCNTVKTSLVLVLYTGGTIGMKKLNENEPCALHLDIFINELKRLPMLLDSACFVSQGEKEISTLQRLAMPVSKLGIRIMYDIKESGKIRESKDTCAEDWIDVSMEIFDNYGKYDGFVILHGTDTMAFTASALSFMFENLGKPVVLTGAQTPIYDELTDARDNLCGALVFAGQYAVPEVMIFFDGKLFRGNRSTKVDAKSCSVFDSPSFPPLAKLCSNGEIEWHCCVEKCQEGQSFRLHTKMSQKIALLPMFPSIPVEMIKGCLEPPIEGVVMVTYGSGNIPDSRTDLITAIREAVQRGVVIVTCCPCRGGPHDVSMQLVEQGLIDIGVVPGGDITAESALTKLSFVLGKEGLTLDERRKLMRANLRGEISTMSL